MTPSLRCARQRGYPCCRGSLHDVLDRYYQAALQHQAEVVVRITADCPVIDPSLIDEAVSALIGRVPGISAQLPQFDFAANRLPPPWGRSYPIGLDVEVCTFASLERAWREATKPYQREHVMPYLYEDERSVHFDTRVPLPPIIDTPPGYFRVLHLQHFPDYGSLRWTVDTAADLELLRQVYVHFAGHDDFTWQEILALFEREPDLAKVNAGVEHKSLHSVDERFQSEKSP